jgi:hypothetical protein
MYQIGILFSVLLSVVAFIWKFHSVSAKLAVTELAAAATSAENARLMYSNERKTRYVQILEEAVVRGLGTGELIAAFAELHLTDPEDPNPDVSHNNGTPQGTEP